MSTDAPNGNQYSDVEHPWRDEEILRELYRGEELSQQEIGNRLGCRGSTVHDWMAEFGIEARPKAPTGKDSPNWKGGKVTCTCDQCDTEYERKPYRADGSRFCSPRCKHHWLSENQTGENGPNWKGGQVTLTCDQCGDGYEVIPARADVARFCSRGCMGQWRSENITGEDSPNWKGGHKNNYGPSWPQAREDTLERGGACRACGMTREEHREEYGRDLSVHHVIPARRFGDIKDAHDEDNLVVACASCHKKYEGLPVFPK